MAILTRYVAGLVFLALVATGAFAASSDHATAADARAMLDRAVAALKSDPAAALASFNKADGGFRDRDLYVVCFDEQTGVVQAHVDPKQLGVDIRTVKQPDGTPLGQMLFDAAKEGTVTTVDYQYPMPGSTTPVAKQSFVTRVGNEGCLVGYYK
jgi:signal transduction histidine kinase